jgi:uncharacterized protein
VVAQRTSLRVRVAPGGRRPGIVGRYGDAWKVRVTEQPEGGKANDAVLRLLAETLGLRRRDVELAGGATSRDKVITLAGLSTELADARLTAAAEGGS